MTTRRKKLVYIVDWLPPDYGAIGQYALEESRERARGGDDVLLVGLSSKLASVETEELGAGRLTIKRLLSDPVDRADFRRRALWTLRTDARLVASVVAEMISADEVLFTASPPFLEHLIVPLSLLCRGEVIFRIADLHPECLMNELRRVPSWLHTFHALTIAMRKRARSIEVLGDDQRRKLIAQGIDGARIVVRRSNAPVDFPPDLVPLDLPPALQDKVVLLYSGAVAHAHDIDTFVAGYVLHHTRGSGRVGLWLNASGVRADRFEQSVRSSGLPIHRSLPVPLGELARLLRTPSGHLVTLRDEYVGLVVPSKVYGCIASGRDVFFIGSAEADVDVLCRGSLSDGAYQRVDVGDAHGVAAALERLADRAKDLES